MIIDNVKGLVIDWGRYMDTVIPKGVDRKLFIHLKYSNREQTSKFSEEHDLIDKDLLEKVAVHEFMKLPEKEIIRSCMKYMEH